MTAARISPWGGFVYDIVDFLFVLIVIYLIVKIFQLDKLKAQEKKK